MVTVTFIYLLTFHVGRKESRRKRRSLRTRDIKVKGEIEREMETSGAQNGKFEASLAECYVRKLTFNFSLE